MRFAHLAAKAVVAVKSTPDATRSAKDRVIEHYQGMVDEVKAEIVVLEESSS